MSLNPTYNIVQRDLKQAYNLFYAGKPFEAQKAFGRVCNNSKQAECGVYKKLWEVMGKPAGHADYGRAAFWNSDGIHVDSMKKSEAIYEYIMTLNKDANDQKLGISNKGRKVIRILNNIIHPRPKNPTAALLVETAQLAMSVAGMVMIGKAIANRLPKFSLAPVSEYSACNVKCGPLGNVMVGSGHAKGSILAFGADFDMVEHERQNMEIQHDNARGRDAYERYERGEEMSDRDYDRAADYINNGGLS